MDDLVTFARRLDEAAATLADAAGILAGTAPDGRAFNVDAPGLLGEFGRALYGQWAAAADARSREATDAARRLAQTADGLRAAASSYADTDVAVGRRQSGEG